MRLRTFYFPRYKSDFVRLGLMTKKFSKMKQPIISSEKEITDPQYTEEILDKAAEKMAEIFVAQADLGTKN